MRLLIVEDEPFIAADLESLALGLDHVVVGVADTKSAAVSMAETLAVDAALLDVKLRDGFTGADIAEQLFNPRKLPFAFVTGNAEQIPPGAFGAVVVVPKPFTDRQIEAALDALAARCAAGNSPN
jgi:CheY-like chemotaxis protein